MERVYEIGEKITWMAGKIVITGVVFDDLGDSVSVYSHTIDGLRSHRMLQPTKVILAASNE
jgi:hypothetical protein